MPDRPLPSPFRRIQGTLAVAGLVILAPFLPGCGGGGAPAARPGPQPTGPAAAPRATPPEPPAPQAGAPLPPGAFSLRAVQDLRERTLHRYPLQGTDPRGQAWSGNARIGQGAPEVHGGASYRALVIRLRARGPGAGHLAFQGSLLLPAEPGPSPLMRLGRGEPVIGLVADYHPLPAAAQPGEQGPLGTVQFPGGPNLDQSWDLKLPEHQSAATLTITHRLRHEAAEEVILERYVLEPSGQVREGEFEADGQGGDFGRVSLKFYPHTGTPQDPHHRSGRRPGRGRGAHHHGPGGHHHHHHHHHHHRRQP